MSCAACSLRIEKAVSSVDGVSSCSVNLLTNSMSVEGTASEASIIKAVTDAGYGAETKGVKQTSDSHKDDILTDRETPILKKRLVFSLIFLALLMYISMGYTMWNFPLPAFFEGNFVAIGILQMLLAIVIMIINKKFFTSGFKSLVKGSPNMDTLVAISSSASFIYSTVVLFMMTAPPLYLHNHNSMAYLHDLYFESAAMIPTLITVGKMLEAYSKGKTTNALKSLISLAPKTAIIISDGEEKEISAADVRVDDIFIVKPGSIIPADGIVIDGHSAVNEAALTGESIPVDKEIGSYVSAATVNQSGYLRCRATKVGEDTALSQIIKLVSDAAATKAPVAAAADKVSGIFVPFVISAAIITAIVWLFCGQTAGYALSRGVAVLVISCPCSLGLATPVAIMVGNGVGAKEGVLFKNAIALESAGKISVVALDKTGTITTGKPRVTDIIPVGNLNEDDFLSLAYSIESKSEHPLAGAITEAAEDKNIPLLATEDFNSFPGGGLSAHIDNDEIAGGNLKFISERASVTEDIKAIADTLARDGKTPLFFSRGNSLIGIIAVADTIKSDSARAVSELKNMGIRVVMLTGDNSQTAAAIGKQTGTDEIIADVLPSGKESAIRELKKYGSVAMVGDGINDAPALTSSDVGIAIGAGTDVAIDAADIVLMKNSLLDVASAIRLSRATLKNIHQNLFWAFIYNIIGIPLAAGVFVPVLGITLNPMFAAAAMSLSSFCVVSNALRLNLVDIHNPKKDRKIIKSAKEKKTMEITMKIEGMMCMHCEGRVKKCLEEIDGVTEAVVSHENDSATVKLSKAVPFDVLKKTVEDQGYKVIE